jgi:hypothetical protein
VKIFGSIQPWAAAKRIVLSLVIGATVALSTCAAPASAETTADGAAADTAATAAAEATEAAPEGSIPVEQTQTAATAPEPGAAQEVTSAVDDLAGASAEGNQVAPEPSNSAALDSVSSTASSVSSTARDVSVPREVELDKATAPIAQGRASELVAKLPQGSTKAVKAVASVADRSATAPARLADQLTDGSVRVANLEPAVLTAPPDSFTPAVPDIPFPTAGLKNVVGTSPDEALDFFKPRPTGLSWRQRPTASEGSLGHSGELGGVEAPRLGAPPSRSREEAPSLATSSIDAIVSGASTGRFGAPAPLNVPPPAPGSLAGGAGGLGGSSFVPLVALLALLALVATTISRKRREVPGFPVPTQFVCALERPG